MTGSGYSCLSSAGGSWRLFLSVVLGRVNFYLLPRPKTELPATIASSRPKEENYRGKLFVKLLLFFFYTYYAGIAAIARWLASGIINFTEIPP
jgi:hypothetical protein